MMATTIIMWFPCLRKKSQMTGDLWVFKFLSRSVDGNINLMCFQRELFRFQILPGTEVVDHRHRNQKAYHSELWLVNISQSPIGSISKIQRQHHSRRGMRRSENTEIKMKPMPVIKSAISTIITIIIIIIIIIIILIIIIITITIIASITKFLIVIGSPRAYLSRTRRTITWVSNYRCPIWTFCNPTPVIGYPRDFHVNYTRFNGFLGDVFYNFHNLGKNSEICYRYD